MRRALAALAALAAVSLPALPALPASAAAHPPAAACVRPWDSFVTVSGAYSEVDWEAATECGLTTIEGRSLCFSRFQGSVWEYSGQVNGSEIEARASCNVAPWLTITEAQARSKLNGAWDQWATYWP